MYKKVIRIDKGANVLTQKLAKNASGGKRQARKLNDLTKQIDLFIAVSVCLWRRYNLDLTF